MLVMKIKKTTTIIEVSELELKKNFYGGYVDLLKDSFDDALESFENFETNIGHLSDIIDSVSKSGFTSLFKDGYTMMLLPEEDFQVVDEFFEKGLEAQEELEVRIVNLDGNVIETVKHPNIVF